MSSWSEKFATHQIHTTLQRLESLLSDVEGLEVKDIAAIESLDRLRQIQRFLVSTLGAVDPNFVAEEKLESLDNLLRQQIDQLEGYKTSQNEAQIVAADNNRAAVLNITASIPTPHSVEDVEGLRDAITSFRRSFGQHARNLEAEYEKLNEEFAALKSNFKEANEEIKSQKARLDTAISQFQQQFSEAESLRRSEYSQELKATRDELKSMLTSGKTEITALTSAFESQFESAETQRQEQYSTEYENTKVRLKEVLDNGKTRLTQLIAQHKETFKIFSIDVESSRKTMEQDFSAKVQVYLEQLELNKAEAEKLVQVIGNTGMVGGCQKVANQERISAWVWHGLTFIFMGGLITFAIIAFHSTIQGDFRIGVFGARAFVAIAFGIGAAWAAREAEKHQDVERRNRKVELELASISPYLALLPEQTQFDVKKELAQRFFGQLEPVADSKSDVKTTGSALDLLRMALEILAKK
ncbi:MAG TPA: hypothetical protein VGO56_02235 [Pyrinomonadaceae bacterium]|jgi:hypothetical protein|nr:hypothetical protein [Pyrinomonadaceae bacterium]